MKDPVLQDEAKHDRECQAALKRQRAARDALAKEIMLQIDWGEHDTELSSYFDATMLMRVARVMATKDLELAFSLVVDDLLHIKRGLAEYAKDCAEKRID